MPILQRNRTRAFITAFLFPLTFSGCCWMQRSMRFVKPPQRLQPELEQKLNMRLDTHFAKIESAAQDPESAAYAKETLGLLRYSRTLPIYFLQLYHLNLERRLASAGVRPYLSYLIDYGYRLLAFDSETSLAQYRRLANIFTFQETVRRTPMRGRVIAFLRSENDGFYRAHSEATAYLTALAVFSSYGEEQIGRGYLPTALLADLAVMDSCTHASETMKGTPSYKWLRLRQSERGLQLCDVFADRIKDKVGSPGIGSIQELMSDVRANGVVAGGQACIASQTEIRAVATVQEVEQYYRCHQSVSTRNQDQRSWVMSGASGPTFYEYWINTNRDVFSQPTVLGGDISQYNNEKGEDIETYSVSYADGTTSTTTLNYSDKTWNTEKTDSRGRVLEASAAGKEGGWTYEAKYSNGALSRERTTEVSGGRTKTTDFGYDARGNVNSIQETTSTAKDNGDGTTTTTKDTTTTSVDDKGNVTTESSKSSSTRPTESASMPVDDYGSDPCGRQLVAGLLDEIAAQNYVRKLDTLINPNVDAPTVPIDDPCFIHAHSSAPTKCMSAFLCLEGTVDKDCRCSGGSKGGGIPANAAVCSQMMCSEGAVCDPATGTCRLGGNAGPVAYEPGVGPPKAPVLRVPSNLGLDAAVTGSRQRLHR